MGSLESVSGPIPLEEAQSRLLELVVPLPVVHVPAGEALGRYLAEPLVAQRTQPTADLSAMDGYAMGGEDLAGPWRVIGESAAGHPFSGALGAGEAVRISTGALMPAGSGAVLLQENAMRNGDTLSLNGEGDPTPRHIRREGLDFRNGQELLPRGTRITPAVLALAIASGHAELPVLRMPTIAVIDSGDELSADPAQCAGHQIPASNGPMLEGMLAGLPCSVARLGPVPDDMAALASALEQASGVDLVVTSGGASVGDHDLIRPALEAWGAKLAFWKVAMKPGKPIMVAQRDAEGRKQIVIGLPGNPVSSYVTAYLFMLPLVRALLGASGALPRMAVAESRVALPPGGKRLEFIRGTWDGRKVAPLAEQDSSALHALSAANALIVRPAMGPAVQCGEQVSFYPLENGGIA